MSALISVSLALSQTLATYEYGGKASRGVLVYVTAFASTHCA